MKENIESLTPLYMEPEFGKAFALRGERLFRVEIGAGRHYRRESGQTYKSLTTFLDAVMPANRFLQNWREKLTADMGSVEKVDEFVQATADYGTALHMAIADFCRNRKVNWAEFDAWAFNYLIGMGLSADTISAAHQELTKDFASLLQFLYDYDVEILAVELPVWLDSGVATLIDLVVNMNAKKYVDTPVEKRQRHSAIINLKSGKKGFFESHILQLCGERAMFQNVFGNHMQVDQVYNLAPTDWRTAPNYKIKNQTAEIADKRLDEQFNLFISIGQIRRVLTMPEKEFTVFLGETVYGSNPADAMRVMGYDEYARRKMEDYQREQAENEAAAFDALYREN
jgi:hypothetical protein